jgi:hypothetical protein
MNRAALLWTLAAVAGVFLVAGVTFAASTLSTQTIGLSSEPESAGEGLAPSAATPDPAAARTPDPTPRATATPRTRRPAATPTATPSATAAPGAETEDESGDDNSGSDGSGGDDSSGKGRGRGRGRGGDDD